MSKIRRLLCVTGLIVVAGMLRFSGLDSRPMHADEAVLADKFGSLLDNGRYEYDPNEYHGPLLAYVTKLSAHLTGRVSYPKLTERTLRFVPAVAGTALALSPLLLAPAIGATAAFSAALLLAVSPACVYYSRYYIPEMVLAVLTAIFLFALSYAYRNASTITWSCVGASGGLMLVTKETAVIALAAAGLSYAIFCRPKLTIWNVLACIVTGTAAVSLFLNPSLLVESFFSYWKRGISTSIHAHPPHYYVALLTGMEGTFTEIFLVGLGLGSFLVPTKQSLCRFLKGFAIGMTAIYSAIPYKTPWCVVSLVLAWAILAGITVSFGLQRRRAVTIVFAIAGISHLGWQAWQASHRFATDSRNQWAYAQTTNDIFRVQSEIRKYAYASPEGKNIRISIYTTENLWPLPWYLREYPNARWSNIISLDKPAGPIVIASPEMEPLLQRLFYEAPPPGHREMYMTLFPEGTHLRPGVELRGYVVKSLWDRV